MLISIIVLFNCEYIEGRQCGQRVAQERRVERAGEEARVGVNCPATATVGKENEIAADKVHHISGEELPEEGVSGAEQAAGQHTPQVVRRRQERVGSRGRREAQQGRHPQLARARDTPNAAQRNPSQALVSFQLELGRVELELTTAKPEHAADLALALAAAAAATATASQ